MEKKQETRKTKSLTQKAKKIRSVVMMTLLCVLLMSAATYAWFTLSKTAKATNLTMTVGETTGLQIAENKIEDGNDKAGTFGSSIAFDKIDGKLLPATTEDGKTFKMPEYNDNGEVMSLKEVTTEYFKGNTLDSLTSDHTDGVTESASDGYYMQYIFWLKSLGAPSTVKLAPGDGITDANGKYVNGAKGTYLLATEVNENDPPASAAVRISFNPGTNATDQTISVFEPNCDCVVKNGVEGADYAKLASGFSIPTPKASTILHYMDGRIKTEGFVIKLPKDEAVKVTMNVWIEGTDDQCVNQISAKNLKGQLVFTKEETAQP